MSFSRTVITGLALRWALSEYIAHFHSEQNYQGKGNELFLPDASDRGSKADGVQCRERLGGLLRYYARAAGVI